MSEERVTEFSTMRTPKDVIRMIKVLAAESDKAISDFTDAELREWVTKKYQELPRKTRKAGV